MQRSEADMAALFGSASDSDDDDIHRPLSHLVASPRPQRASSQQRASDTGTANDAVGRASSEATLRWTTTSFAEMQAQYPHGTAQQDQPQQRARARVPQSSRVAGSALNDDHLQQRGALR